MYSFVSTLIACLCFQRLHAQITEPKRFPSLMKRVDNCTVGCYYCPEVWKRSWVKGDPKNRTATSIVATVFETLNEQGDVIEASTNFATLDQPSTNADGTQVGFEDPNTIAKETGCNDDKLINDHSLLPIGTVPVPKDDPNGLGYDIWTFAYDASIAANSLPQEVRTCEIRCNQQAIGDDTGSVIGPTVALTASYVTTTQKTTIKGNAMTSAAPGPSQRPPASPTRPAQSAGSSGVATGPNPGSSSSKQAGTTGQDRVTTTDERGSTIIVPGSAVQASPGPAPSGQVTFTNVNGQTVVVQGATTAAPGQFITTTDDNGSVYSIQIEGVTVTNVEGSVLVIQGGTTGTLAVIGTSTVLVQGSTTLSSWEESSATVSSSLEATASTGKSSQRQSDLRPCTWALMVILGLLPIVMI